MIDSLTISSSKGTDNVISWHRAYDSQLNYFELCDGSLVKHQTAAAVVSGSIPPSFTVMPVQQRRRNPVL